MADKPTLYQPFRPSEIAFAASELAGAIDYQVPSRKPPNRQYPEGEWCCRNPECVVREVRVFCKLHGAGRSVLRCPACQELLKFHHWLRTETLVPYQGDAPSA